MGFRVRDIFSILPLESNQVELVYCETYMGQPSDKPPVAKDASSADSFIVVFKTLGDTTWRMFVPVILGAVIGLWIDGTYGTKYAAVIGSTIGLVLAGVLVWYQYKEVTKK